MTAGLDIDPELLDLVRRSDPMLDPRAQAESGLDTESGLRLLAPQLADSSTPRRTRRRRRAGMRIAVLTGAFAAAAFVVGNIAPRGDGPAVSTAQARTMIRHARAALSFPPDAIVEEDSVTTSTAPDGSTSTSEAHQWLSTSPPYNHRTIIIQNNKMLFDQTMVTDRQDVYDPATNTVYLASAPLPNVAFLNPEWASNMAFIRYLLARPHVTIDPNAVLNGAPAIEFTFNGGQESYWASPNDYQPLQSENRQAPLPDGQVGVAITRFPIDRVLTGASASPSLLSLQAQHPGATIDQSSADYQAALSRLGLSNEPVSAPTSTPAKRR